MSIGPDGHGWCGTDRNGNSVYKDDWELEAEAAQRQEDKKRAETLFVSPEYKVFFLTSQPGGDEGRKAYISIKPFCTLSCEAVEQMTAKATPWDQWASNVTISLQEPTLVFHDQITKTDSKIYVGELDSDVRAKLRFNQASASAWGKYADVTAPAAITSPVAIAEDIPVSRPLTFRKHDVPL